MDNDESNVGLWISVGFSACFVIIICIIVILVIVYSQSDSETDSQSNSTEELTSSTSTSEESGTKSTSEESNSSLASESSGNVSESSNVVSESSNQAQPTQPTQPSQPVIDPGEALAVSLDGKYISLYNSDSRKYCSDTMIGITCEAPGLTYIEKFLVKNMGGSIIALKGSRNNKFCSWDGTKIVCNSDNITDKEMFKLDHYSDSGNYMSLRIPSSNKYCSYPGNYKPIACIIDTPGIKEEFKFNTQAISCADYNGNNVKCSTSPDNIFMIQTGKKSPYTSNAAFVSMNGTSTDILNIDCNVLNSCPIGDELKGSLQYQAEECQKAGKSWFAIEQKCLNQAATEDMKKQACIDKGGKWVNPYNVPGFGQCVKLS